MSCAFVRGSALSPCCGEGRETSCSNKLLIPQNQVQSSRNRLSLSVTLPSFPLLLVLIRQGFVCNQTPSCCCTRGLSQSGGFDDPGAALWCWEREFALENAARIGSTGKGSKIS